MTGKILRYSSSINFMKSSLSRTQHICSYWTIDTSQEDGKLALQRMIKYRLQAISLTYQGSLSTSYMNNEATSIIYDTNPEQRICSERAKEASWSPNTVHNYWVYKRSQ